MASGAKVISLLSVAVGLLCLSVALTSPAASVDHIMERCQLSRLTASVGKAPPAELLAGAFDFAGCFNQGFFADALATPGGAFVMSVLGGLCVPAFFLTLVESGRHGASKLAHVFGLICTLGQAIGIGHVMPIIWLPLHLLRSSQAAAYGISYVPTRKTSVALAASIGLLLFFGSLTALPADHWLWKRHVVIFVFVFVPLAPLYLLFNARNATHPGEGVARQHLVKAYYLLGGASLAMYATAAWNLLAAARVFDAATGAEAVRNIAGLLVASPAAVFLICDFIGLFSTCVLLALYREGVIAFFHLIVSSIILSPGAAVCFYLAARESLTLPKTKVE